MKNIKNTLAVSVISAGLAVGTWSCQSVVSGHEVSPNAPTNVAADQMLLGTELSLNVAMQGEASRMAGIFAGYFTGADRQYISYEDYAMTSGDFNGFWGSAYAGVIKNCRVMQDKLRPLNNRAFIGATQVMEAHAFGTLTSLFGDVPFSEAINLDIPNPAYDGQAAVYAGIQSTLDDAIANLQSGAGSIPAGDAFYGGSTAAWIAAAHTLKARFYLHVGDYPNALIEAQSGIASRAGDMMGNINPDYSTPRGWNLGFQFMYWDRPGYMTASDAYLPSLLGTRANAKTDETDRDLVYYARPADYPGEVYGSIDPNWDPYFSNIGYFGAFASTPILSYAETQLIAAEAASREGDDVAALGHLNNARTANADLLATFTGGQIGTGYQDYLLTDFAPGVGIAGDGATVSESLFLEIMEERYITLYGTIEGFIDITRTDNVLGVPSRNTNPIPERFLYPQAELNNNSNTPTGVTLYDPTPINQ